MSAPATGAVPSRQVHQNIAGVRQDIQALRGLAVAVVVLYHADLPWMQAGYLGVDIFFVISGYLITGLIVGALARDRFRFAEFYWRRAKRLMPAALVTLLTTALLAPWLLLPQDLADLAAQVAGAITFTANIVLWQQSGYFDTASELKPLLHTWSLSVEEQYYLLLPALLVASRGRWLRVVGLLALLSASLCALGMVFKPVATFYLLPTRAWELLIGSLGALLVQRHGAAACGPDLGWMRRLFPTALLVLMLSPLVPWPTSHPGLAAALVTLATLVVILRCHPAMEHALVTRALAWLGDRSYSLYLVHWPLFALLKNAWVGPQRELPLGLRLTTLALSVLLACALYRFVENPVRHSQLRPIRPVLAGLALASLALALGLPALMMLRPGAAPLLDRTPNYGLHRDCDQSDTLKPLDQCRSGSGPARVMVWGDSFAMHLLPGLVDQLGNDRAVVQATRTSCGPLLGLGPEQVPGTEGGHRYNRNWAHACIDFNASVLRHLAREASIETVVMSSTFSQYANGDLWRLVGGNPQSPEVHSASPDLALSALKATVRELQRLGKKVIVIAPPPLADFNAGMCLERQHAELWRIGGRDRCDIDITRFQRSRARELALLDGLERQGIPVLRFEPHLCDERRCRTEHEGIILYRDHGHLTVQGSKHLARTMDWATYIQNSAK